MAKRTETVGVRLTDRERQKFESFVEESPRFDSLSRLFRVLAHQEINTEDDTASVDPEEITRAVDSAVSSVTQQLDDVEEHVLSIDANTTDDDKIGKLAKDIYNTLPVHESGSDMPSIEDVLRRSNISEGEITQQVSTAYVWSQFFDSTIADTRRGCARMLDSYPDAEVITENVEETGKTSNDSTTRNNRVHDFQHNDGGFDVATEPEVDVTCAPGDDSDTQPTDVVQDGMTTVRRYYKTRED